MPTLYATRGLSGSGKSTTALTMMKNNPKLKRVERDSLREMVDGGKWSPKREKTIVKTRDILIGMYLDSGFDVISSDTNLNPKVMDELRRLADEHGAAFQIIDLTHVPYEECVKNDLNRLDSVGEQVIKRQWIDYLCPPLRAHDPSLPNCIIFDLDGSVADISHRNPYDASTCEQDAPREHVIAAIRGMVSYRVGRDNTMPSVFAFSGRSDKYFDETQRWLDKNFGRQYDTLFMRKEGDTRKDAIVKREMFEAHVEGKFNVFAVVDDRPQVIRQWRMLGLPTIDVSEKLGLEF